MTLKDLLEIAEKNIIVRHSRGISKNDLRGSVTVVCALECEDDECMGDCESCDHRKWNLTYTIEIEYEINNNVVCFYDIYFDSLKDGMITISKFEDIIPKIMELKIYM